jgi:penicillin-binding protein 1C
MFDDGSLLPQMLIPDIPTYIGGYHPQNFHRDYDGLVPASAALAR